MTHAVSAADQAFRESVESGELLPGQFDHRAHLRLAYVYLAENGPERACERMRDTLHGFLARHGVDPGKYHETLTRAWILAVRHFMSNTADTSCADAFIDANPDLLDTRIMLTHYSAQRLFSDAARECFIEPDLQPMPLPK
jgi:hypothetical protein